MSKSQDVAHRPGLVEEDYPLLGPAVRDGNTGGIQELANNPNNNPEGAHGPLQAWGKKVTAPMVMVANSKAVSTHTRIATSDLKLGKKPLVDIH